MRALVRCLGIVILHAFFVHGDSVCVCVCVCAFVRACVRECACLGVQVSGQVCASVPVWACGCLGFIQVCVCIFYYSTMVLCCGLQLSSYKYLWCDTLRPNLFRPQVALLQTTLLTMKFPVESDHHIIWSIMTCDAFLWPWPSWIGEAGGGGHRAPGDARV